VRLRRMLTAVVLEALEAGLGWNIQLCETLF